MSTSEPELNIVDCIVYFKECFKSAVYDDFGKFGECIQQADRPITDRIVFRLFRFVYRNHVGNFPVLWEISLF